MRPMVLAPEGVTAEMGLLSSIVIDADDHMYLLHRGGRSIDISLREPVRGPVVLKFNPEGKLVDSLGAGIFVVPHMMALDQRGHLWITDLARQQVLQLDSGGKPGMALGRKFEVGNDTAHFNRPTDIVFLKDRYIYVGDGYGNSRIVQYTTDGRFVKAWGESGSRIGEFDLPHSIALSGDKLFVADRENARIQVFDRTGRFLSALRLDGITGRPLAIVFDRFGNMIVTGFDATAVLNKKQEVIKSWPVSGHDVAVDSKGAIYLVGRDGLIKISSDKR